MANPHDHPVINPPGGGYQTGLGTWGPDADEGAWAPPAVSFWSGIVGSPGVSFRVEVASAIGTGGTDFLYDNAAALYDEALYSTGDLTWFDITSAVRSVSADRGRDHLGSDFRPGLLSLELSNESGIFNPLTGQQLIGDQALRPGRWVRFSGRLSEDQGEWVPLWLGRIDTLGDIYKDAAHDVLSRWSCMDLLSWLEAQRDPELPVDDPLTEGQLTSERVRYIWDVILELPPEFLLTPDVGVNTMQGTTFPGSRLDQMRAAANAEGGDFYANKAGQVVFRNQTWLEDGTQEGTIQFDIGTNTSDIKVLDVKNSWDAVRVKNGVYLTREGGVQQGNINSSSQAIYGRRDLFQQGLQNDNDIDVAALVALVLDRTAFDTARVDEVEIWASTLDAVQPLLDVEVGWRVFLQVQTALGWAYVLVCWVSGITHTVTADNWVTRLRLDNTDRSNPLLGGPYAKAYSTAYKVKEG